MRPTDQTAAYYDQDLSFMLVEIAGEDLFFQAMSRLGRTVDAGVIRRQARQTDTGARHEDNSGRDSFVLSAGQHAGTHGR